MFGSKLLLALYHIHDIAPPALPSMPPSEESCTLPLMRRPLSRFRVYTACGGSRVSSDDSQERPARRGGRVKAEVPHGATANPVFSITFLVTQLLIKMHLLVRFG